MPANKKLLILPGDGIGPEVMREVRRIIDWMDRRRMVTFDVTEDLVGGAAIDARKTPITDATMQAAKDADAILFGSVGGPKWDKLGFDMRPEIAILRLRKELDIFANLRPAIVFDPLVDASTLKPDVIRGLDIMIVRESTGGIYFGEPRGVETLPDGQKRGFDTETYTTNEIERVARVAFELARKRQNRVCSVEKANVMQSGLFWRQTVTALREREFPDVELSHMYADNCAMQLVRCATAVRRDRDLEHLRRPVVRSGFDADRQPGDVAVRDPRRGAGVGQTARVVRTNPRQRAGYRRQGHRQSAGAIVEFRDAAALFIRHGRGCRADRESLRQCVGHRPAYRRYHGPRNGACEHERDGRVDHAGTG